MNTSPYKVIVLKNIAALLKPLGFLKKGNHFTRKVNDIIHLISLQSSTSSTASLLKITINLGIWVPSLEALEKQVDICSAHWHERLGNLMPIKQDFWWVISPEQEAENVAKNICDALSEFGIAKLNEFNSSSALEQLWATGQSPGLTQMQAGHYLNKLHEQASLNAAPKT